MPSYVQHESFSTNNGRILDPATLNLGIESSAENLVAGRVTMKPMHVGSSEASFDVEFRAAKPDPCKHLGPLEFTGNEEKPARTGESSSRSSPGRTLAPAARARKVILP